MGQWAGAVTRDIQMVDESMAEMVANGDAEAAAAQYLSLSKQWRAAKGTSEGFKAAFVDSTLALRDFKPSAKSAAEAVRMIGEDAEVGADRIMGLASELLKGAATFMDTGNLIKANQQAQQDAAQATADANNEAAQDSSDSWRQHYDGLQINLSAYLTALEGQVAAQDVWKANIDTLSRRGIGDAILADLGKLGEAGAPLVQALATSTDVELQKYVELWRQGGADSASAFAQAAAANEFAIKNALAHVGTDSAAALVTALKEGRPIEEVLKQFGLDAAGNPIPFDADTTPAVDSTNKYLQWVAQQKAQLALHVQASLYGDPTVLAYMRNGGFVDKNGAPMNAGMFATGGYTGDGGKYQAAGLVHKGEFVMDKESTSRIGVDTLYGMMRGQSSARSMPRGTRAGFADGGAVGGGGWSTVDAQSLQAIMALANRPIYLYTDDRLIAESASRGGVQLAQTGTN
jgi:phage-related minor tail protein